MKDNYEDIDCKYISEHYGSLIVVDQNLEILKYAGEYPEDFIRSVLGNEYNDKVLINNNKINISDWSIFLYNLNKYSNGYVYNMSYNEIGNFYFIIKMPVSVTLIFDIEINKEKQILPEAIGILTIMILACSVVLFIGFYIYSKITAGNFVKSLNKLCEGVKNLENENYKEYIDISENYEFQGLAKSFNNLCNKLDKERNMRKKTEYNRKRLILDISHDIKNPLAGIMGSIEMCMKLNKDNCNINRDDKTFMAHYLKMAYNNGLRANNLIESLFEYSKLESPDYSLNLKKIDFCEFVRTCILKEIDYMEEAGIEGEYDIPDKSIYAYIDEREFSRVLHNLISNSIKYNERGTSIKISLSQEVDKIKLIIEDNGIGMDKSLSDDIFIRFKRDNNKTNCCRNKTEGTGLGLAIVKKIVNMHNGEIYLKTDINKGCIFTIEL